MSPARVLSIGFLLATFASASCGTSAEGIDDCRKIERARCVASDACGTIDDTASCERFYRDHCLHGLAVEPPGADAVAACVEAIRAAGACAALRDDEECEPPFTRRTACEAVKQPQTLAECAFLDPSGSGTGGTDGGSTGGTSSQGGSPDGSSGGSTAQGGSPDGSGGTSGG